MVACIIYTQFCSNLETDHTEDGELCAVLQMVCHETPNWHYLSVNRAEMACLKAIILFNSGKNFLPLAN